jgi:hypothetical protein
VSARLDGLPEGLIGRGHFRDTGCEVAPSCLACPLPICRYDRQGGARSILNSSRNREIQAQYSVTRDADTIAVSFGISRRTVFRVIKVAS